MRADAHYVDQLESPAQPVIRLIAIGQIDCRDLPAADGVAELTRSVATHGVLQPLMVRKQGTRYSLIAGRKPGDVVTLTVQRGEERIEVPVTLRGV